MGKLPNPYVGPRPFEPGETLYGRGREARELFHKLKARRIVLLHSPSGAGKSSLVEAALRERLVDDRFDVWPTARLNLNRGELTGNRFVASTIASLEDGVPEDERRGLAGLAGLGLAEYVKGRPRGEDAPESVVLVFDQFEEVLTADPVDVEAKKEFFRQLGETLRDPRIWALFAVREDYLAALAPYRDLVPTKLANTYRIDLLGRDAAREAIVETARDGGREFPAAERLLDDLATMQVQQPDGSFAAKRGHHVEPVQLQVTCRRLWDAMPDSDLSIDVEDLEKFGDVDLALAHYYRDCAWRIAEGDVQRERAIREWFGDRLVTSAGVRGQVLREAGSSGGLDNVLVERLLATHLVRAEKRAGATWYELAHDRLLGPVREDNGLWREEHLSEVQKQASLWERQGRPSGLLFLKQKLTSAERWAADNEDLVTDVERDFLAASRAAHQAAVRERRLLQVTILVALIAIVAGVFAVFQWQAAVRSAGEAAASETKARELARAAMASSFLASGQGTSGNLAALEVREPDEVPTAVSMLQETLATRLDEIVLGGHEDYLQEALFSPEGRRVLTASGDHTARIWNAETGEQILALDGHSGIVVHAAWSGDGRRVLTASGDNTARIWNAETGEQILALDGHSNYVYHAAWSGDEQRVLTASGDHTARIWNAETGEQIHSLERHSNAVRHAVWSGDGRRVLTASRDHTARIWNA
ncbi:MAG: hypothetical protein GY711_17195, partial [bacterium]|nr:hypothetical protein [bacterium]